MNYRQDARQGTIEAPNQDPIPVSQNNEPKVQVEAIQEPKQATQVQLGQKEPSKLDSKFKPEKEGYKIIIDKNGRQRYQKINIDPAVTEKRKQSMLSARQKLPEKREHIQEVKRRSYQQQQQLLQTVMDEKKQNELMRQQIQQLIDQSKQLQPLAQRVVERSKSRENLPPPQEPEQMIKPTCDPQRVSEYHSREQKLSDEITQIVPDKWKQYWDQQRSNGILGK